MELITKYAVCSEDYESVIFSNLADAEEFVLSCAESKPYENFAMDTNYFNNRNPEIWFNRHEESHKEYLSHYSLDGYLLNVYGFNFWIEEIKELI